MLDEKGRLFGKINIVDLLIVVIIIAAIAFVGFKYVLPKQEEAQDEDVVIEIVVDDTRDYVVDNLVVGAKVYDYTDKIELGTCSTWTSKPLQKAVLDSVSQIETITGYDSHCVVDIVVNAKGVMSEHGVTVNGTLLGRGHTLIIYVGDCKLFGTVKSMSLAK